MSEPMIFARASRFEEVRDCYRVRFGACPGRLATDMYHGYPICRPCRRLINRLDEASDLHYTLPISDHQKRCAEVDRRMTAKYGADWRESREIEC